MKEVRKIELVRIKGQCTDCVVHAGSSLCNSLGCNPHTNGFCWTWEKHWIPCTSENTSAGDTVKFYDIPTPPTKVLASFINNCNQHELVLEDNDDLIVSASMYLIKEK